MPAEARGRRYPRFQFVSENLSVRPCSVCKGTGSRTMMGCAGTVTCLERLVPHSLHQTHPVRAWVGTLRGVTAAVGAEAGPLPFSGDSCPWSPLGFAACPGTRWRDGSVCGRNMHQYEAFRVLFF